MQLLYNGKAKEQGIYIIGACGWDSIPADMGVIYTKNQFKGQWTLNFSYYDSNILFWNRFHPSYWGFEYTYWIVIPLTLFHPPNCDSNSTKLTVILIPSILWKFLISDSTHPMAILILSTLWLFWFHCFFGIRISHQFWFQNWNHPRCITTKRCLCTWCFQIVFNNFFLNKITFLKFNTNNS